MSLFFAVYKVLTVLYNSVWLPRFRWRSRRSRLSGPILFVCPDSIGAVGSVAQWPKSDIDVVFHEGLLTNPISF